MYSYTKNPDKFISRRPTSNTTCQSKTFEVVNMSGHNIKTFLYKPPLQLDNRVFNPENSLTENNSRTYEFIPNLILKRSFMYDKNISLWSGFHLKFSLKYRNDIIKTLDTVSREVNPMQLSLASDSDP